MPRVSEPVFRNHLLASLPAPALGRLRPSLKRVELPFGHVLNEPGSTVKEVVFLEKGIASLLVVLGNGDSIEVALVGAEGVVGIPPLFEVPTSAHRVTVQGTGHGYRLDIPSLRQAMRNDDDLRRLLLQSAYRTTLEMAQNAACNRLHEAEERLARWLLLMDDRHHDGTLQVTHELISLMLGTRRSTVTIASGILARAGLIEHRRGTIRVVNRPGLEAAACECYALMRNAGNNGDGNGKRPPDAPLPANLSSSVPDRDRFRAGRR